MAIRQTKQWTVRVARPGREAHPKLLYRNRKDDALGLAERWCERKPGLKASVKRTKGRVTISYFNSEKDGEKVIVHSKNIDGTHQDGSRYYSPTRRKKR